MCTSFRYKYCFCRNFDYEVSYDENIVKIPRNRYDNKYSIIGVCAGGVVEYPLLYDGMNEFGLCMSGLAFKGYAKYVSEEEYKELDKIGIAVYDFIMQVLGNFKSVSEVREYLKSKVLVDFQYSKDVPNSELHWQISDDNESIIVESVSDGLMVYDASVEVLTNNPQYPLQLDIYEECENYIGKDVAPIIRMTTRGTETMDMDGSYTSSGRFERCAFLKHNLEKSENDFDPISQSFNLLSSVEQIYGSTPVGDLFEYTIYSVVYDMKNKDMYVRTYDDYGIHSYTMNDKYHSEVRCKL